MLSDEILPRSEEAASTAVPVELLFNYSTDEEKKYRAVIEGISTSEFRRELEDLYADKEAWGIGAAGDEDELDVETLHRINDTLSKLKCIYPHLQTTEDLSRTSVEKLLSDPDVKSILDVSKTIECGGSKQFARSIKEFIDASRPKGDQAVEISLWPLVKVVKIYSTAEILRHLSIVDLPGNLDTSAARIAVTDNYRKNLTMSCILSPAVRAASDKSAHELLNSAVRRNMQLDGIYNSESVFFVVTKTDQMMDYEAHIRDHPNMEQDTAGDRKRVHANRVKLKDLEADLASKSGLHELFSKRLQKRIEMEKKNEPEVEKVMVSLTKAGIKRKREITDFTGKLRLGSFGSHFTDYFIPCRCGTCLHENYTEKKDFYVEGITRNDQKYRERSSKGNCGYYVVIQSDGKT